MSMTDVNQDKEHNKICLFGGTFDPIHKGHIDMARIAADIYGFNKVYILPTGNSYLKSNVSDTEKRCEMVRLAIKDYSDAYKEHNPDLFEVSYYEARSTEPSYTYKTLQYYEEEYTDTDIYYLIGEDSLRYIDKWKCSEEVFRIADILVARRNKPETNIDKSDVRDINEVVDYLKSEYKARIEVFDYDEDISSTKIRKYASCRDYGAVSQYLTPRVLEYIKDNNLYII